MHRRVAAFGAESGRFLASVEQMVMGGAPVGSYSARRGASRGKACGIGHDGADR